ncbi:hypothetical protein [Sinorhizobium meliloti]
MRTRTSHKPALVRYVRLAIRGIKWALDFYRLYELVVALADGA